MDLEELYRYAYIKRPLTEVLSDVSEVPEEYLMDYLKDAHDYQRHHTSEEIARFAALTPEQRLQWLEEAARFMWEAKKQLANRK